MTDLLVEFLTKDNISHSQLYPFFKGIYINFVPLLFKGVYILYPFFKVLQYNFTSYEITERLYMYLYNNIVIIFIFLLDSLFIIDYWVNRGNKNNKEKYYKMRIGYCDIFNIRLLGFS